MAPGVVRTLGAQRARAAARRRRAVPSTRCRQYFSPSRRFWTSLPAKESTLTACSRMAPSGGRSRSSCGKGGRAARRSAGRPDTSRSACRGNAARRSGVPGRACMTVAHSPLNGWYQLPFARSMWAKNRIRAVMRTQLRELGREVARPQLGRGRSGRSRGSAAIWCPPGDPAARRDGDATEFLGLTREQRAVDDRRRGARRRRDRVGQCAEFARRQCGTHLRLAEALRGRRGRGRSGRRRPRSWRVGSCAVEDAADAIEASGAQVRGRDQDLQGTGVRDVEAEFSSGPIVNR